ncbi:hypothetical protein KBC54_01580 [Patescibacteria group bacterium]|nr:hypothetical protein [Patescibacteria group bacterium]
MSSTFFTPQRILISIACLGLVAAMSLRFTRVVLEQKTGASTVAVATSTIPAFTSATVHGGDVFSGLGPEWTYLLQDDLKPIEGQWLAGTVPVRNAVVKVSGKETQMMLIEMRITNEAALRTALKNSTAHPAKVGEKNGYVIPMNDSAGGTGFALIGNNRVLLIQNGSSYQWPAVVQPEIQAFISSVLVP